MATRTRSSKPLRQLGELLQEQQEPFILEVYLSERGCCHGNSGKFLDKCGSQNKSKKKRISHFPKVLKASLCNKLFKIKGVKTKNSDDEETEDADRFSSASSATMYNSCSDSDVELDEPPMFADTSMSDLKLYHETGEKAAADTEFEWRCMEEQVSTSTSSCPLDNSRQQVSGKRLFWSKLIKEDSILSAWLLNLLLHHRQEKSSCVGFKQLKVPHWSTSSRPSSMSKRVLQQAKQLLFDCVRELVENNHDKEQKGKSFKESGEEIRKVRCENMKGWGKRCGDGSNIKQLLELDIINSTQEWKNGCESQKRDVGIVIGNAIVEEITSEVVMDIMNVL
ncbi:hypothetical protein ERO13_A05G211900v2 [Gossypium hirsutum]|uniref:DUF4378 domain-containing protein n=1 Tax=Gossypium hirsutum TaxID=3635 RepID=A0ABM3BS07_GOSHI|nr:uncharacterized protein LOC107957894 [Gossypium hirsutum]KAG4200450.1 hypothetical protein ERO13_A05G211900v2 [Gossypium hirsutum]